MLALVYKVHPHLCPLQEPFLVQIHSQIKRKRGKKTEEYEGKHLMIEDVLMLLSSDQVLCSCQVNSHNAEVKNSHC